MEVPRKPHVVKDVVCTKVKDEKGGEKRGRPEKGRDKPQETVAERQPIWGMLYADDSDIISRSKYSLKKMMEEIVAVCVSFGLKVLEAKTETMPDDETCGQAHFRYSRKPARCTNKPPSFVYLGATKCVREHRPYCQDQPTRAAGRPTLQMVWLATVRPTHRAAAAQSTDAHSRGNGDHAIRVCHVDPHHDSSHQTADGSPPIAPPLHCIGRKKKSSDRYHISYMLFYADTLSNPGCENVETAVRKRRVLFAGSAARTGNETLPKRVVFDELEG